MIAIVNVYLTSLFGFLALIAKAPSTSRRIASDREGLSFCCLAQLSISVLSAGGSRSASIGLGRWPEKLSTRCWAPGPFGRGDASHVYKITQLWPSESDDFQYRIKWAAEPHERVVKESQLDRAA